VTTSTSVAWPSERVLVTGGASFIGSHLTEELVEAGASVRVADDLSSGRRRNLARVSDEIELYEGNLKERGFADRVTRDVDTVFHLAADHGGRGYISNYPANCATNMALDNTVFEMAAKNGVDRITFASSACAYPTEIQREKQRLSEDMVSFEERGGAHADEVYGWAKLMGERSLRAYHEQYGIDAASVRIFTAYGPRENETHAIIALLAKAYAEQEPFRIWGDGGQTRNFTYVRDVTRALRLAAERITDGSAVNAGTDRYISIDEVATAIFDAIGWEPNDIEYLTDKPVGVRHRAADTTKAADVLGWEPRYTLDDGIERTLQWYVDSRDKDHVRENLESLLHER
jgi:UDP-glucose 4-epimerase